MSEGRRRADGRLAAWAGLAAVWGPPLVLWTRIWSGSAAMAFGWAVPPLAAFMAVRRWRSAPPAAPARGPGRLAAAMIFALGLLAGAAALPVLDANPGWPTAEGWSLAGAAAATLGALAWTAGWRFSGWFLFPAAFVSTALNWPTAVQVWVVDRLTTADAGFAADVVSLLGHPAVASGRVIAVRSGLIGVAEACSGIRSLQAVWMAAWFLGELAWLNAPRRAGLVLFSLLAALVCNLLRAIALTWVGAVAGTGAVDRWHGLAGSAEIALVLGSIGLLAWRASRRGTRQPPARAAAPFASAYAARALAGMGAVALATGVAAEIGTQAWYGAHERVAPGRRVDWRLAPASGHWRPMEIPAAEIETLQCTRASALAWVPGRADGASFAGFAYAFDWTGGAAQDANAEWHDPSICLPAAGATLVATLGPEAVAVHGIRLPFTGFRFSGPYGPAIVYFCHWDAALGSARGEDAEAEPRARRWQRVREGRRGGAVDHIIFYAATADASAAAAWLRAWAPRLLQADRP